MGAMLGGHDREEECDEIMKRLVTLAHRGPTIRDGSSQEEYEAGEHINIGDEVFLKFKSDKDEIDKVCASIKQLSLPNGITLTYGQIIALAGDMYGIPEQPIADVSEKNEDLVNTKKRFMDSYGTLAIARIETVRPELESLTKVMCEEKNKIIDIAEDSYNPKHHSRFQDGGKIYQAPSDYYKEHGRELTIKYDETLGGQWSINIPWVYGRMMELAATNTDHFLPHAKRVYLAGHESALEKAREASRKNDHDHRMRLLQEAYSIDAFACHFLTDSFSAGHMRTPRVEIPGCCYVGKSLAGLLVLEMHNEDNIHGINVQNGFGAKWAAFGDGTLLDEKSKDNKIMVVKAVQASVDQIFNCFLKPDEPQDSMGLYFPMVDLDAPQNNPLFSIKDGYVYRRRVLDDLSDTNTTWWWFAASTYAQLKITGVKKNGWYTEHTMQSKCNGCRSAFSMT